MKHLIYSLLTAALCLCVNSASAAEQGKPVTNYKEIQLPELNSMQVRQPERYVMENGMTVYLLEDHEVPLIDLSLRIYTGSRWEPADKAGLADIVGEVMRTGGSKKFPGDELDDELDNSATSIEIGIGRNEGSASINSLKHNFAHSLEILTDLLQNPVFPEEKIALCKQEIAGGIVRRNDDASGICSREFNRLIRGKDSPYGHQTELTTLANISREDLIRFHQQYFQPQNMILGVWGDFSAAEMKKLLAETLGQWKKGTAARPAVPGIDMKAAGTTGVYLVEKTDIEQSFIRMGHIGGLQSDPDYYALILEARNSSNTAQHLLAGRKQVAINYMPEGRGWPIMSAAAGEPAWIFRAPLSSPAAPNWPAPLNSSGPRVKKSKKSSKKGSPKRNSRDPRTPS